MDGTVRSPASPNDPQNYKIINGGKIDDIPNGSYVEGSSTHGGAQPDYYMDLEDPIVKTYREKAKELGKMRNLSFWDKIDEITNIIADSALIGREYDDKNHKSVSKKYLKKDGNVPFSEYLYCSAGVCREYALLAHILLKEAGIENTHMYATIHRKSNYYDYDFEEDHAFNVVKYKGEEWVVDTYYVGFNGYRLKDLMSKKGITEKSKMAPVAEEHIEFRRIVEINNYPRVWIPKKRLTSKCMDAINKFIKK
ncbi:arylamine N-acetyltransferase [Bacteriovorax sp. BSW11_IV]|uniref:arylamine N-acetyltransferase n=1 Tax=Bacteriovorax sp. BSW11_IV TaxID=1353529 RepID=UPI0012DEF83E|nr:arylamine N-acetyltransferase [Bacteriovorax sp. BSW11_IV]